MEKFRVSGITTSMNVAKIVIEGVEDKPGTGAEIFSLLGDAGINVELMSQSGAGAGLANISFVVLDGETSKVVELLRKARGVRFRNLTYDPRASVITVYGEQLRGTPGVVSRVFQALSSAGVNIDIISTSLNGVSVVVARDRCSEALKALNSTFEVRVIPAAHGAPPADADEPD